MKASLVTRLDTLHDRFEELTALLGDAQIISDQNLFRDYSKEYAEIEPVMQAYQRWRKLQDDMTGAQALLKDSDPGVREMAEEEISECRQAIGELESQLDRKSTRLNSSHVRISYA